MRVMPSVTDTMVPTLRASVDDLKFSIRCLMRSEISVALMAIYRILSSSQGLRPGLTGLLRNPVRITARSALEESCRQLRSDAVEPRAQRAVDYQVAGAQ